MGLSRIEAERTLGELQHGRRSYRTKGTTQLDDLAARLRQAADWCARFVNRGAVAQSLRPPRLAPHPFYANRWDAVDDVADGRASDLRNSGPALRETPSGRLLAYFPDAELADGAAEVASEGFFDVNNAPPWGTWVGYFEDGGEDPSYSSYLIAWVPICLVELVNLGIDVNPEACIAWRRETKVRFRDVLDHVDSGEASNPLQLTAGSLKT